MGDDDRENWSTAGAALGALGVVLGAFGAHALDRFHPPEGGVEWWRTAAHYHLIHALALLHAGRLAASGRPAARAAAALFLGGTVVFSGTLYLMALGAPRWFGAITPLGGLALIAGWFALALAHWRGRRS
ncbi:MAG: DUF423 domain-containing protein [Planctomycetota bacterium]